MVIFHPSMNDSTSTAQPIIHVQVEEHCDASEFKQSFRIGRDPSNDLVLNDPCVSNFHAEVFLAGGLWSIRDLNSGNGTFVDGVRVEETRLVGSMQVRLGVAGPRLRMTVDGADQTGRPTVITERSEDELLDRLLGDEAPEDMSRHTMMVRDVLRRDRRRLVRRYAVVLAAIAAVAVGSIAVVYIQRKQLERLRRSAEDVFYAMKTLELEVSRLQLDTIAMRNYRRQQERLRQTYMDYLQELGVYGEDTPQDVQLIYHVIHRFGESEISVTEDFIEEVREYIERWRRSARLPEAMARARQHGAARSIADILLEYNMPPEFLYLALQESGLNAEAVGPETRFGIAKGPWQLMPETARAYGLRLGPLVGVPRFDPEDDRHQLEISTRVAARHLRFIYTTDAQASGLLVMAAYNWGHGNVVPLIQAMPENPRERNFWTLLEHHRDRIPSETYNYVFNIIAAAVVGENPSLFGFDFEPVALRVPAVSGTTVGVADASQPE